MIAKIDVGAKGALVSFHNDSFPDPAGLIAYAQRLHGTVKLRPDSKLVITRDWGDPQARLNGADPTDQGAERHRAKGAANVISAAQ